MVQTVSSTCCRQKLKHQQLRVTLKEMTILMQTGSSMKSLRGITMRSGCLVSSGLQAAGPSLEWKEP